MKNSQGYSPIKMAKSPTTAPQSYMGYLTQKQIQQLYKHKKEQESDKDSYISGHSNKGRRMKLRNKLSKTTSQVNQPVTMKKKSFDFPDHHYRDAISRLKSMLSDTYSPPIKYSSSSSIFKSVTDDETDTTENTIIERPALKEVSKYFSYKPYSTYSNASSLYGQNKIAGVTSQNSNIQSATYSSGALMPVTNVQPPNELLNFIERQENYIEQLEKESNFCRDELNSLMTKVKDVISENETLSEVQDDGLYKTHFPSKFTATSGPNILFESRISELEAQLAQITIDYKKLVDENAELKRKRALNDSSVDIACSDAYKKQIENLQRDKSSLEETVKKLQKQVSELKELDAQVFSSSQRNRDLAEQANFERVQNDIEIRRLKDELERQHERIRELQTETAKRIAEERTNAERRFNYQVDQLGGDLTSQWEHSSKLQLELERMKRSEADFKRELASKMNTIDELKGEIKMKTTAHLSDMAQINSEKHSLEQEIANLRMQLERVERTGKIENARLNAENTSLRQRLDRADADLLHSRRENLRLCDQISNLEKEIALGEIDKDHRPKDVKTVISEIEEKHAKTVQELESMISEQRQLMEKLTDQCKNLTQKLEDTTSKHKKEKQALRQTNQEVMDRLKKLWNCYKEKSLERLYSSISSSSSTPSATVNDYLKEINNLQTDVEFLTTRINQTSSVIAESNSYNVNEVYETSNNNNNNNNNQNISYNVTLSSPKIEEDITQQETSIQALENPIIETNINNSYYPSPTETLQYEQNARIEITPKRNSIKNVIDDNVFEAISYEPPTYIEQQPVTNIDSAEWNRASNTSFYPSSTATNDSDNFTYQSQSQYQPNEYEKYQQDSRTQSRSNSRAGSRSNSRPSSRPMSRASSQQRFYDEANEYQQQQQPRSLSRNDSQRSITDYSTQRPTDTLITTRIEESYVEPSIESVRKPSVTFKHDEQELQNIQPMVEQRDPLYTNDEQTLFHPQSAEYDYGQQNMGYTTYEQPSIEPRYYQPESRRQSPEQEYRSYVEPQTPKRSSPPKTPTREQSREDINKTVQQRQQSRDQLYEREEIQANRAALTSKQQSRDNLSETPINSSVPTTASSTSSIKPPLTANAKQVAPLSPKRTSPNVSRNAGKGGPEQKISRNTMGEATGTGRKSDNVQKQPPKISNIRGKK